MGELINPEKGQVSRRLRVMDSSVSGVVRVFVGERSPVFESLSIKEIVQSIIERLGLAEAIMANAYGLAEVVRNSVGRLGPTECPIPLLRLWPKNSVQQEYYRFQVLFMISGDSIAGKSESTNFLLHHLSALRQKG